MKELLFTTEDGVKIYKNTNYTIWLISKEVSPILPYFVRECHIFNKNHLYEKDYVFYYKANALSFSQGRIKQLINKVISNQEELYERKLTDVEIGNIKHFYNYAKDV